MVYRLFQNCHELEKMDLEECVQVNEQATQTPLPLHVGLRLQLWHLPLFIFASDHRWNTHTAVYPLPSFASSGECVPATYTLFAPVAFTSAGSRVTELLLRSCRACLTVS